MFSNYFASCSSLELEAEFGKEQESLNLTEFTQDTKNVENRLCGSAELETAFKIHEETVKNTQDSQDENNDENIIVKDCLEDSLINTFNEFEENVISNEQVHLKEKANQCNTHSISLKDDSLNQSEKQNNSEKNIKDRIDRELKYNCRRRPRNNDCSIKDFSSSDIKNIIFVGKKKSRFWPKLNQFRNIFRRKEKKEKPPQNNTHMDADYETDKYQVSFKEDVKMGNISLNQEYGDSKRYDNVKNDINGNVNRRKTKRWPKFNLPRNVFRNTKYKKGSEHENDLNKPRFDIENGSENGTENKKQDHLNDETKKYASNTIITEKFLLDKESRKVNKHALDIKSKVDEEKSERLPRSFSYSFFRKRTTSQENNDLKSLKLKTEKESNEDLQDKGKVCLNNEIKEYASDSIVIKNGSLAEKSDMFNKKDNQENEKPRGWSKRFSLAVSRKKKSKNISESDANPSNEKEKSN